MWFVLYLTFCSVPKHHQHQAQADKACSQALHKEYMDKLSGLDALEAMESEPETSSSSEEESEEVHDPGASSSWELPPSSGWHDGGSWRDGGSSTGWSSQAWHDGDFSSGTWWSSSHDGGSGSGTGWSSSHDGSGWIDFKKGDSSSHGSGWHDGMHGDSSSHVGVSGSGHDGGSSTGWSSSAWHAGDSSSGTGWSSSHDGGSGSGTGWSSSHDGGSWPSNHDGGSSTGWSDSHGSGWSSSHGSGWSSSGWHDGKKGDSSSHGNAGTYAGNMDHASSSAWPDSSRPLLDTSADQWTMPWKKQWKKKHKHVNPKGSVATGLPAPLPSVPPPPPLPAVPQPPWAGTEAPQPTMPTVLDPGPVTGPREDVRPMLLVTEPPVPVLPEPPVPVFHPPPVPELPAPPVLPELPELPAPPVLSEPSNIDLEVDSDTDAPEGMRLLAIPEAGIGDGGLPAPPVANLPGPPPVNQQPVLHHNIACGVPIPLPPSSWGTTQEQRERVIEKMKAHVPNCPICLQGDWLLNKKGGSPTVEVADSVILSCGHGPYHFHCLYQLIKHTIPGLMRCPLCIQRVLPAFEEAIRTQRRHACIPWTFNVKMVFGRSDRLAAAVPETAAVAAEMGHPPAAVPETQHEQTSSAADGPLPTPGGGGTGGDNIGPQLAGSSTDLPLPSAQPTPGGSGTEGSGTGEDNIGPQMAGSSTDPPLPKARPTPVGSGTGGSGTGGDNIGPSMAGSSTELVMPRQKAKPTKRISAKRKADEVLPPEEAETKRAKDNDSSKDEDDAMDLD